MIDLTRDAPPGLRFAVDGVEPLRGAATPTLRLRARVSANGAPVRGLALNVDVRIAAERRRYGAAETERLRELFGPPEDWARSLGPVPWLRTAINAPAFETHAAVDVALPAGYDFDVVAVKYATALDDGVIPVDVLFTGNVFYATSEGRLQTAKIAWDSEVATTIPLRTWRDAVDAAFPDAAWLRLDRALLVRLQAYRSSRTFTTWDETIAALLAADGA